MCRLITLASVVLVLALCGCHRDAPTAPDGTAPPSSALPSPHLAGFAVALRDVRDRILPTLGNGPVFAALGSALEEVEGALFAPDTTALEGALARANEATTEVPADSSMVADLDVVLLVLQQIAAVARAPAASIPDTPSEPSEPTDPRGEP